MTDMMLRRAACPLLVWFVVSSASRTAWAGQVGLGAPTRQPAPAVTPAPMPIQTVIKSQHVRLPFPRDIQRVAVGDTEILSAELINSREVLALGRETGRTTLIVWFVDGLVREYLFSVQRDLSVLQAALTRVNPSIEVRRHRVRRSSAREGTAVSRSGLRAAAKLSRRGRPARAHRR
jgi:Flp pilus assembly secretin CpaC